MDKRLLDVEEIAEYLGLTVSAVYIWVSAKEIPYVKMGRLTKFDLRRIDAWIEECSVEPIAKTWEEKNKPEIEKKIEQILDDISLKKACSKCKKEKPLDEFYKNIRGKNVRSSYCKVCADADAHRREEEKKKLKNEALEKGKEKREQSKTNEDKQICKVCGKKKHIDEFYKDLRLRNGRTTQCKACTRAKRAERVSKKKLMRLAEIQKDDGKKDEKEKVPSAIGGECEIRNSEGKVIFKDGQVFGKEGEELLRRQELLDKKENE